MSLYFRPVCSDYLEPLRQTASFSSDRLQHEFSGHTVGVACLLECLNRLHWGGYEVFHIGPWETQHASEELLFRVP